ncbi:HYD1 signature containing ADP-ribosyltransferase family protein [Tundrisphaera sp. TA3]|uniref:HYD1 signature containing ADP-ribosyltransferase family protein n=1 Tax=Tundrisphaera sp. TA3 TaxID=3435775 RepID=UPI003EBF2F5B
MILYHYTDAKGMRAILESGRLLASTAAANPQDVRYGDGQYLSNVVPGTKTPAQLSRESLNQPFQGRKFTHYIAIEVEGLELIWGRPGVCVIPNVRPLELGRRLVGFGENSAPPESRRGS